MSNRVQKYPLANPLARFKRHDQLPSNAKHLLELIDDSDGGDKTYTFVKLGNHLSILISYYIFNPPEYYCDQLDFPLAVLSWFPKALEEFRKPPSEGGLHAGAMISKDIDVDGEMLALGSSTDGYYIINRSRNQQDPVVDYDPAEVPLSWHFLYEVGLLEKWKKLGEQYDKGQI